MRRLKWSISNTVFVSEIDDEHKEIFDTLGALDRALSAGTQGAALQELTKRVADLVSGHFAHEERLMRASRYASLTWHKRQHNAARKRVRQWLPQVNEGDRAAGKLLIDFLHGWFHNHTRLADRMMGAFLRNRNLWKVTIQANSAVACPK